MEECRFLYAMAEIVSSFKRPTDPFWLKHQADVLRYAEMLPKSHLKTYAAPEARNVRGMGLVDFLLDSRESENEDE